MRRREFLGASPALLGARLASPCPPQSPAVRRGRDLSDELSATELETVNSSVMAKDLDNFFGKGFS